MQTEITHQDLAIIEQLFTIAQRHSAEVLDAKTALGFSAFQDTVSLELEPSFSLSTSNEEYANSYSEGSFSSTIAIDPIRLISIFQRMPALRARLKQTKKQKRVEVVKFYIAYIQARQAIQIMSDRMQTVTDDSCTKDLKLNSISAKPTQHLSNKEHSDIAVELLNANGRTRIALEELAACVGLSPQETRTILENSVLKQSP
ncbi:hypothetical protein [Altericista sp. CCNU0014]|uniref:hypothetical protein n=1 Tax=Altericista sp. CCNU0014 TaxID=3082949 RepID=UPI00384AFA4B